MKSRTIVFVVGSLRRGGAERQLVALAQALRRRDWDVVIFCLGRADNPAWERSVLRSGIGIEELGLGRPRDERRRGWDVLALVHAFRRLRRIRPNVVYCFMWWSYMLFVPIAKLAGVPVIATCRQSLSDTEGARRGFGLWHRLVDRMADAVVCVSEAAAEDAVTVVRAPARKVVVIPNGVEVPPHPPDPPPAESVTALTLANLHPYKGHAVLLDAIALARHRLLPNGFRLAIAGEGAERERLEDQAARLGIDDHVDFLGAVEDITPPLRSAAFTVLPSLSEGLSLAVMESMANARAVVATAVGGTPELLGEGGGILVPPSDPNALAAAIVDLASDRRRRTRLGREAYDLVRTRFSIELVADRTEALFERLASSKELRGTSPAVSP